MQTLFGKFHFNFIPFLFQLSPRPLEGDSPDPTIVDGRLARGAISRMHPSGRPLPPLGAPIFVRSPFLTYYMYHYIIIYSRSDTLDIEEGRSLAVGLFSS